MFIFPTEVILIKYILFKKNVEVETRWKINKTYLLRFTFSAHIHAYMPTNLYTSYAYICLYRYGCISMAIYTYMPRLSTYIII